MQMACPLRAGRLHDRQEGQVHLHKRLTSSDDPSRSAMIGLQELMEQSGARLADVGDIVHGTTLVTNAIIERKGAARLGRVVQALDERAVRAALGRLINVVDEMWPTVCRTPFSLPRRAANTHAP